jgi:hypothetical protein
MLRPEYLAREGIMSKSFDKLVSVIGRMYSREASKYTSLISVFNGLADPLATEDKIGVATAIIHNAVEEAKKGNTAAIEGLRTNLDDLMNVSVELDALIRETEVREKELARNPI